MKEIDTVDFLPFDDLTWEIGIAEKRVFRVSAEKFSAMSLPLSSRRFALLIALLDFLPP